ncbi:MAG: hypothetical protein ACREXR_20815, partial [Gammaproteobacteria bacterium]
MKRLVPLAIAFALFGSGAAQAAPPEELNGNQAQKTLPSTKTRQPSATGQSSEQSTSTQGA